MTAWQFKTQGRPTSISAFSILLDQLPLIDSPATGPMVVIFQSGCASMKEERFLQAT